MGRTEAVPQPLIGHDKSRCNECWGCVRCCPVRAIRMVGDHPEVVQAKCVACGVCVAECGRGGYVVRDDTPLVRELLAADRPVIALLASEFIAALHPMTVNEIERSLEALGFVGIETTLLGEETVAEAYKNLHVGQESLVSIRSTCPVAVDFVRKYYPGLVPALAPIVPPYVAQARLIRQAYGGDYAIVYMSPCYARKDEYRDPQFEGLVDAVLDFSELRQLFQTLGEPAREGQSVRLVRPSALKELSLTDGFPRHTLESRDLTDASVYVARGIDELDRLLRAVVAGEAGPSIIDMLNCDGCIDGPAVNPGLTLFAKRNIEASERERPGTTHVSTKAILSVLPSIDVVRSFTAIPVHVDEPTAGEVDAVLSDGRFTRETALDCGACGWETCVEHAGAIFRAESSWELCLPLQRALHEEQRRQLQSCEVGLREAQTLDAVTGLWNRRAFGERLDVEIARHHRYGSPLSIALVDVDAFGHTNDLAGRDGGDAVLREIGRRLAACLRATDVVARLPGDQFGLILPGIGKTAAFAVGEKLRAAVAETPFVVSSDGYTGRVSLTVSMGVAAASEALGERRGLLEAADAALHDAMATGRDRVHLAPG